MRRAIPRRRAARLWFPLRRWSRRPDRNHAVGGWGREPRLVDAMPLLQARRRPRAAAIPPGCNGALLVTTPVGGVLGTPKDSCRPSPKPEGEKKCLVQASSDAGKDGHPHRVVGHSNMRQPQERRNGEASSTLQLPGIARLPAALEGTLQRQSIRGCLRLAPVWAFCGRPLEVGRPWPKLLRFSERSIGVSRFETCGPKPLKGERQ